MSATYTCPRCGEADWVISGQTMTSTTYKVTRFGLRQTVAVDEGVDSDSFSGMTCRSCQITLAPPSGEWKVRHGNVYDTDKDFYEDAEPIAEVGPLYARLCQIAYLLLGEEDPEDVEDVVVPA